MEQRHTNFIQECDLLMPVCNYFRDILIKKRYAPEKIITHHSAIDCEKFAFKQRSINPNEPIHIVTTARLVPNKGLDYAIRAVALVKKKYPNIKYTIIGGGSCERDLRKLVQTLYLSSTVRFVGRQNSDYVARALDTAHIFILPSVTVLNGDIEGIPNALKEAMASGVPVIATYHSGNPELITDGISGFLVPEKNVPALAQKIEYLIEHPERWPAMSKAAREKIEQEFDTEKENDKLVAIFEKLLTDESL